MKMQGPKQKQGQNIGTKRAFTPTKQLVEVYRKLCVVLAEDIDANYMVCLK